MKIINITGLWMSDSDIEKLSDIGSYISYSGFPQSDEETLQRIGDAQIIITFLNAVSAFVINHAINLKCIVIAATGYDMVDLKAAQERNIMACYSPGYATQAVAEHTIGLMIAASRYFRKSKPFSIEPIEKNIGKQLKEKTLGIIGFGKIGQTVAQIAQKGFGMRILFIDCDSARTDFEYLLKESDIISLHAPLTEKTCYMIGNKEFSQMKDGVIFINTARGKLVDESSLMDYLKNGKVAAAGLDVVCDEPLKKDNPLLGYENVIITPHIAYCTQEALENRSHIVTQNILLFLSKKYQEMTLISG